MLNYKNMDATDHFLGVFNYDAFYNYVANVDLVVYILFCFYYYFISSIYCFDSYSLASKSVIIFFWSSNYNCISANISAYYLVRVSNRVILFCWSSAYTSTLAIWLWTAWNLLFIYYCWFSCSSSWSRTYLRKSVSSLIKFPYYIA